MLTRFRQYLWQYKVVAGEVIAVIRKHLNATRGTEVFSLGPKTSSQKHVLLSYVTNAFSGRPIPYTHTAYWESRKMAESFVNVGYDVDVISAGDARDFLPQKPYSIFIGHRHNFERIASRLSNDCIKVLHCDVAHWSFHNTAGYNRLLQLQQRKGVTLSLLRLQETNRAIEHADMATVLGNEFTISTYRYAQKPIYHVPVSTPVVYPWFEDKQFEACRRTFLWFNSNGFVHKGLDLILEAFASMPEYRLIVCGPIDDELEKGFVETYHKELYETANIQTAGWVEDGSEEFVEIANKCIGVISASCSEGGGGSVISCMQAGLIPVVNYETSVDVESFGILLRDCSIDSIAEAVKRLAALPASQLRDDSRRAWEFARTHHSRERFAEEYSKFAAMVAHHSANAAARLAGVCQDNTVLISSSSHGVDSHVQ